MTVPADPKRPWKAYAATALSGLSVFVAAWVADTDPFTQKEIVAALVAAVIGSGITGATTYAVANPPKPADPVVHDEFGAVNWLAVIAVAVVILVLVLIFGTPVFR